MCGAEYGGLTSGGRGFVQLRRCHVAGDQVRVTLLSSSAMLQGLSSTHPLHYPSLDFNRTSSQYSSLCIPSYCEAFLRNLIICSMSALDVVEVTGSLPHTLTTFCVGGFLFRTGYVGGQSLHSLDASGSGLSYSLAYDISHSLHSTNLTYTHLCRKKLFVHGIALG